MLVEQKKIHIICYCQNLWLFRMEEKNRKNASPTNILGKLAIQAELTLCSRHDKYIFFARKNASKELYHSCTPITKYYI